MKEKTGNDIHFPSYDTCVIVDNSVETGDFLNFPYNCVKSILQEASVKNEKILFQSMKKGVVDHLN